MSEKDVVDCEDKTEMKKGMFSISKTHLHTIHEIEIGV
jgi:hypothetical protein